MFTFNIFICYQCCNSKFCDKQFQVACSCLVSLFILDSKNMVELLNTLISLHSNTSLKNTLQFDLSHIIEGDVREQIKDKIVNSVKIVLKTVELVYSCFVGEFCFNFIVLFEVYCKLVR